MFSLEGKVAIVTGASKGVGLATSKRFLAAGANVVMACRSDIEELANNLGAIYVNTDVRDEDAVKNLFDQTIQTYGKIDIVVNNAGVGHVDRLVRDAVTSEYLDAIQVNLMGTIYGLKYASTYIEKGGSIINISSLAGVFGSPAYGAYSVSKAGVAQITKVAALELADKEVRVNCICPASINTEMMAGSEIEAAITKVIWPLGRMAEPEEVAATIHFLAADDCTYMTGQIINLDGGYSAGIGTAVVEAILKTRE